jgi:enterochelin esterase-like enzyme
VTPKRSAIAAAARVAAAAAALAGTPAGSGEEQPAVKAQPPSNRSAVATHRIESEYQAGAREIRVLLPDAYDAGNRYRVLYVLPVGTGFDSFGYGLGVLRDLNAHNRYNLIVAQMDFSDEPWYGDHATNRQARQASYLKETVVPFVERTYPTLGTPEGRLLLGFSKSGWGAVSLLLKYPEYFGYAASWDAPLLFQSFHYGMERVYGTKEQLAQYAPALLAAKQKAALGPRARLVIAGEKVWGSQTAGFHKLLADLGVPHAYDDAQRVPHDWNPGWVEPTLKALMDAAQAPAGRAP